MGLRKIGNRAREFGSSGALILASALILWRFFALGLAPFIRDEPILQTILDEELFTGHRLPLLGLMGSYGLRYGPTAMWFYLPLRLFTADARAIVFYHALTFLAAFAVLYFALKRAAGEKVAAWALLFAASSPLLFFYSRQAWDNTLFTLLSALLLYCLGSLSVKPSRAGFFRLGLLCGLALNTHIIAIPLVAAALICAISPVWAANRRDATRFAICAAAPILILLAIYAVGLALFWKKWEMDSSLNVHPPAGELIPTITRSFPGLMQYFTPYGAAYFFDDTLPAVPLAWLASRAGLWISAVIGWGSVALLVRNFRWKSAPIATRFALLSLAFALLFYAAVRPDPIHPHYFTPYWWIGFYAAAILLVHLPARWGLLAGTTALLLIFGNAAFIGSAMSFLARNEGTRGIHFSTALEETERVTEELCNAMTEGSGVLHLEATPGLEGAPFAYFANHLEACRGKQLFIFPRMSPVIAMKHYEVRYGNASPFDASLTLALIHPERKASP
ncbi:MAG: glycosyltransferase family 39 protein [Bdellovibrionota bacterium]